MKSNFIVLGVLALVIISMIALNTFPFGLRKAEAFQMKKKEGFQPTVADVKAARAAMGANSKKEGFQDVVAANPLPPRSNTPQANANPTPQANANPAMTPPPEMPVNTPPSLPPGMLPQQPIPMPNAPAATVGAPATPPAGVQAFQNVSNLQGNQFKNNVKEGFASNYADVAGGAKDGYKPMGAFDGVVLPTGNKVSTWRYTAPNEELLGAPFAPGDDSLFIFKNNQCKPECCGSSFSCSGGCICSTPDQRNYINGRGGNRTSPAED